MEKFKKNSPITPMLFPYEPQEYWEKIRQIVREEIKVAGKMSPVSVSYEVPGLTYKPLYKIEEVCSIFTISRPTVYDWVKHGKLKPYKIRSRVYFLWNDITELLKG